MMIRKLLSGSVSVTAFLIGAWLYGYDFNERGVEAMSVYAIAVFSFLPGYYWSSFDLKRGGSE